MLAQFTFKRQNNIAASKCLLIYSIISKTLKKLQREFEYFDSVLDIGT